MSTPLPAGALEVLSALEPAFQRLIQQPGEANSHARPFEEVTPVLVAADWLDDHGLESEAAVARWLVTQAKAVPTVWWYARRRPGTDELVGVPVLLAGWCDASRLTDHSLWRQSGVPQVAFAVLTAAASDYAPYRQARTTPPTKPLWLGYPSAALAWAEVIAATAAVRWSDVIAASPIAANQTS